MTWKSRTERPEESGRYLCIVEHGGKNPLYKLETILYDADDHRWKTMYIADFVVYWTDMPEVPPEIDLYAKDRRN